MNSFIYIIIKMQILPSWKLPSPFQSLFQGTLLKIYSFRYKIFYQTWMKGPTHQEISVLKHCLLVRKGVFGSQPYQWPNFHWPTPFLQKQFLNYCFLKSARELINNYHVVVVTSAKKSISRGVSSMCDMNSLSSIHSLFNNFMFILIYKNKALVNIIWKT